MPFITYQDKLFHRSTFALITQANEIIEEYQAQGFDLTLRQLFYQFVARELITNTQRSYKRLGSVVNDARLAGLIDWGSIVDRTRNLKTSPRWRNPAQIVHACSEQFHVDHWKEQAYRPEVWIEKEALIGVISGICETYDVPYFACRGYVSQSEQWRAGQRFHQYLEKGQKPIVFHLGDHDPSGLDMTRDNRDRLKLFSLRPVEVRRLALSFEQIEQYGPPPNPAKQTDARFDGYQERYGDDSWELDALEPAVIVGLIEQAVQELIDPDAWEEAEDQERSGRAKLRAIADDLAQG